MTDRPETPRSRPRGRATRPESDERPGLAASGRRSARRDDPRGQRRTGGHLGAGLGVVELTVALHAVFDTPRDKLIWDVSHQCYPHKISDRAARADDDAAPEGRALGLHQAERVALRSVRRGPCSTSISAALGFAIGRELGAFRKTVRRHRVIGDGAMTGGMAYEATEPRGHLTEAPDRDPQRQRNVHRAAGGRHVVLPVAALCRWRRSRTCKAMAERRRRHMLPSPLKDRRRGRRNMLKGMTVGGTVFEELGFSYVGPLDGHDHGRCCWRS